MKRLNLNVTFKTLGVLSLKKRKKKKEKKKTLGVLYFEDKPHGFLWAFPLFFNYQFYCSISILLLKYFFIFYT